MQRAQRAAASPMRAILEAAKVKRRVEPQGAADTEGAATAARRAPPRVLALGAGEVATRSVVASQQGAPVSPLATGTAPVATAAPNGAGTVTIRTLAGALPRAVVKADVAPAGLAPVGPLAPALGQAELLRVPAMPRAQTEPELNVAAPAPRLLQMVEPDVPIRVLEALARPQVTVEFTIGSDGGVSGVKVITPAPRQLAPPVIAALEQWRYEPQREPRLHRVVLVFSAVP